MVASQRLDKWLWAARFFKTRTLATDAINGGKAQVNGERVKASRHIKIGDRIALTRNDLMEITVCGLDAQRRSASEAQRLYQELPESILRRQQQAENNKFIDSIMPQPSRRPGKKDRRQIAKFVASMK